MMDWLHLIDDIYLHAAFFQFRPVAPGSNLPLACFMTAWLGLLGAVIGSFLNVVIYRLPLGMSLSYPGSHCPRCKHPIRWYDNVPVLGWLWLKGRCRDCRTSISGRYPAVELFVGLMFAGLAWSEIFERQLLASAASGSPNSAITTAWLQYAYHLLLVCTLVCAGLMEYDGQGTPARLWLPVLCIGLLLPLAWPEVRPVAIEPVFRARWAAEPFTFGLVEGVAGAGVGAALGIFVELGRSPERSKRGGPAAKHRLKQASSIPALTMIGTFLGWQAACWIIIGGVLLRGVMYVCRAAFGATSVGVVFCLSLAGCAFLFVWSWLHAPESSSPAALAALAVAAAFVGSRLVPLDPRRSPANPTHH
jgi:prepilin signal peptidase PulO-like enzyme (type II secretory pathway)